MMERYGNRFDEQRNTLFALLAPDAEESLSRVGRSPRQGWSTPEAFASALVRLHVDQVLFVEKDFSSGYFVVFAPSQYRG